MSHSPIKGLILDMDGVLWKGSQPLVDLPAFFNRLRQLGLPFVLATNNATRSSESVVETMRQQFGVQGVEPGQVVTSGMAVTYLLKQRFPSGGPVYVVGETNLIKTLEAGGFVHSEDGAVAVVAGLDRTITYDKLRRATLLIRAGVPFYGTNPDVTFPTPEGQAPGAGSILAAIETASGVAPLLAGKPERGMLQMALDILGTAPRETLAIGDRLDTDILGGQRTGCLTGLVLTGVSTLADLAAWEPKPDFVAANAAELIEKIVE